MQNPSGNRTMSGKSETDLDLYGWKHYFEKRLRKDIEAHQSWNFLVDKSCSPEVLEVCLFRMTWARESAAQLLAWETVEKIQNHRRVCRIRELADFVLTISDGYPSEIQSELWCAYRSLTKAGTEMDSLTDLRIFERATYDYYLPLLSAYVSHVTGRRHFRHLAAVGRCACKADDPKGGYSADAVRNYIKRFKTDYRPVWMAIEKAVQEWQPGDDVSLIHRFEMILAFRPFGQIPATKSNIDVRDPEAAKRYLRAYEKSFPQVFYDIRNALSSMRIPNSQSIKAEAKTRTSSSS